MNTPEIPKTGLLSLEAIVKDSTVEKLVEVIETILLPYLKEPLQFRYNPTRKYWTVWISKNTKAKGRTLQKALETFLLTQIQFYYNP